MNVRDLHAKLAELLAEDGDHYAEWNVVVPLSNPSIGPHASSDVVEVRLGFDWDNKTVFLRTEDQVVTCRPITKEQLVERMKPCVDVHERHGFFKPEATKRQVFEIGYKEGFKSGIFARAESIE